MASDLLYIIPPYLLNTSLGLRLKQQLLAQNEELGTSNVISSSSRNYVHKHKNTTSAPQHIIDGPVLDQIFKEKLWYKLSIMGVLGTHPMDQPVSDSHLVELWGILKSRIVSSDSKSDDDEGGRKRDPSIFSSDRFGEVFFSNTLQDVPEKNVSALHSRLKELISSSKQSAGSSYNFPRSFVKLDDEHVFDYSLPVSWAPLVLRPTLVALEKAFNLQIHNDKGHSSVKFSLPTEDTKIDAKYVSFVTDKPVVPSSGIFYYETEVFQETTAATDFEPLIPVNDLAVSSETSLHLWLGFLKQHTLIGSQTSSTSGKFRSVDLESVKNDIYYCIHNDAFSDADSDINKLLLDGPDRVRGSYVINFENLKFCNSIRSAEAVQRSAVINMNRRLSLLSRQTNEELDHGDIELEVPFNTNMNLIKNKRLYRTDVIGCGINYIEKSLFITLNGILVKTISYDQICARTPAADSLFGDEMDNSVYPFVGFELKCPTTAKKASSPSRAEIRANFGFKEFKFNINNYVKEFKTQKQRQLYLLELDQNRDMPHLDNEVLSGVLANVDDPATLHELIKGYLNHEGYLTTYDAFSQDLQMLKSEIDEPCQNGKLKDNTIKETSLAYDRKLMKQFLFNNQFDELINVINMTYANSADKSTAAKMVFEVNYTKYLHMIKTYLDRKLGGSHEFNFGLSQETDLFKEALLFGSQLQSEYKAPLQQRKITELSKALLVTDKTSLHLFPKIKSLIENYTKHITNLHSEINRQVLKSLGYNDSSDLETIINSVSKNIEHLSTTAADPDFVLINYEDDYVTV